MKYCLFLLSTLLFSPFTFSQNKNFSNHGNVNIDVVDMSGTWVGTRKQYNRKGDAFIAEFEYMFELKQEGNSVSGTSYIKKGEDYYAEVKIKGRVIGNKFHFQEYEMIDQRKPENRLWCFKIGELEIDRNERGISVAEGETQSFTSNFYVPCSGGYSYLERIDDYSNETLSDDQNNEKEPSTGVSVTALTELDIYPNPFAQSTTVKYNLSAKQRVSIKLYDIDGKLITSLAERVFHTGQYNFTINAKDLKLTPGVYILELNTEKESVSRQLVLSSY